MLEDIPEVAKNYKVGEDIEFTATFNALFDPENFPTEEEGDDSVIDVEVEEAS